MLGTGKAWLWLYRIIARAWGKAFSLLIGDAFHSFGKRSVLQPPLRLDGERRIAIGDGVFIGGGSWLQALAAGDRPPTVALRIGNGVSVAGHCVLSAVHEVVLEDQVLLARNVYIADHIHAYRDLNLPVSKQGVDKVAPVRIGAGAWLGQNVVVCPGVTIGRGAVIGANAVVTSDIPDHCVAVGAPARVVKRLGADHARNPDQLAVPTGAPS
jgi:lipopolysaccharide O-acetyltransferase